MDEEKELRQLIQCLKEIEPLLQSRELKNWYGWPKQSLKAIEGGLPNAMEIVLSPFGGQGSLNDVELDERAAALTNQIYLFADRIRRKRLGFIVS